MGAAGIEPATLAIEPRAAIAACGRRPLI